MIFVERGSSPEGTAAKIAHAIRAWHRHMKGRTFMVAANEDGTYALTAQGRAEWDLMLRNPTRIIGTYLHKPAHELLAQIAEDLRA